MRGGKGRRKKRVQSYHLLKTYQRQIINPGEHTPLIPIQHTPDELGELEVLSKGSIYVLFYPPCDHAAWSNAWVRGDCRVIALDSVPWCETWGAVC